MTEITDMRNAFVEELEYMEKGKSTMMGSQIYINLKDYVKKLCYENNFNTIDVNGVDFDGEVFDEEDIVNQVRSQMEYDFNSLQRGEDFMMEEKLDYFNIKWLENAYEYHKWNEGFGCIIEEQLESKVNFMMYLIARECCEKWIEEQDLDLDLW